MHPRRHPSAHGHGRAAPHRISQCITRMASMPPSSRLRRSAAPGATEPAALHEPHRHDGIRWDGLCVDHPCPHPSRRRTAAGAERVVVARAQHHRRGACRPAAAHVSEWQRPATPCRACTRWPCVPAEGIGVYLGSWGPVKPQYVCCWHVDLCQVYSPRGTGPACVAAWPDLGLGGGHRPKGCMRRMLHGARAEVSLPSCGLSACTRAVYRRRMRTRATSSSSATRRRAPGPAHRPTATMRKAASRASASNRKAGWAAGGQHRRRRRRPR